MNLSMILCMNKISCAIIGGTGYTAGELIRILLYHPHATIKAVYSTSHAGAPISSIHRDLIGETDLCFCGEVPKTDVLFLCLGHGLSAEFLQKNRIDPATKVIDLGNDFRINGQLDGRSFVYGLPELFRNQIRNAARIANPGCFATAIELALLPLAQQQLLREEVHIHAITGSTGAGRGLSETAHFSYRNNNLSVYKAFTHQHLDEIKLLLHTAGNREAPPINFIPVRGNFTRGIFATLYTRSTQSKEEVKTIFAEYYKDHPFTFISDIEVSLKEVVNTNKCLLHIEKHQDYIFITSIIDNLLKGASGQAVQNMNLLFGFAETAGLLLKSVGF